MGGFFVLANINFSLDLECCSWKSEISRPGDFGNLASPEDIGPSRQNY